MDGDPHPKDDHVRRPYEEKGPLSDDQDPDPNLVKGEVDSKGGVRVTVETHDGTIGTDQPGTKSGSTQHVQQPLPGPRITNDPQATAGPAVTVDANRMFQVGDPAQNTPGVAEDNRAALAFLWQELDHLRAAATSEDIVRQITSVYSLANNLVQGPNEWEPGLKAEFEAWVPYEISSGVQEYEIAKDTVLAAGETVYESARVWSAEQGAYTPIAGNPNLAAPLWGIGAGIRQAITAAIEAIQTSNASALDLLRQAVADLSAATDAELVCRYAGTVFSMVGHLLHGDARDAVLADEEQAWATSQPTEAVATAAKDHLVPAAEQFFQSAHQMVEWYPFHSLMVWDAPVPDLLSAGQHARSAATP